MPRTGQIIPSYSVPHVMTVINDNSIADTSAAATDAELGARYLCVFRSSRGEDGVIKTFSNTSAFLKEYGTPDFKEYGQANLMPYVLLATGNAQCHCLRVTAEDATYSTVVIRAKAEPVTTGSKRVKVTFTSEPLMGTGNTAITDLDEIETAFNAIEDSATATTGYPLFVVYAKGKGKFGNSLSVKIAADNSATKETGYIYYVVNINDSSSGTPVVLEQALGTFDETAIVDNGITYLDDIINDPDTGSSFVGMYTSKGTTTNLKTGFERLIDDCNTILGDSVIDGPDSFDIFAGKKKNAKTNIFEKVTVIHKDTLTGDGAKKEFDLTNIDENDEIASVTIGGVANTTYTFTASTKKIVFANAPANEASIVVTAKESEAYTVAYGATETFGTPTGAKMQSGSDGTFDNDIFVKAFNGEIDPAIKSKRSTPCEYILDANFDDDVKKAMIALAINRGDLRLILDAGTTRESVTDIHEWYDNITDEDGLFYRVTSSDDRIDDTYLISKECQWYKTRDPFTNRIIPVTATYFIAQNQPTHIFNYGNQVPFVGGTYATLSGHVKRTLKPVVDADDLENKEILYGDRFNFFESIAENTYVRATQSTSQVNNTDLSEDNNVDVLLEMKRMLENFANARLYNFASSEDRTMFTEDAVRLFSGYTNTKVKTYDVYFDMNSFEAERSIMHCYLAVTFRSIGKRGIVEIDINKRTT